jgi:hypothetical protein
MGEVNLIKQALLPNDAEPAALDDIAAWWPFMDELRRRGIPITIHSHLGNDPEPLKYLYLMEAVLALYPNNKIVWSHMGLSEQLTTVEPRLHIDTLRRLSTDTPSYIWTSLGGCWKTTASATSRPASNTYPSSTSTRRGSSPERTSSRHERKTSLPTKRSSA